jgi:predicted nucleotidyltransferase
MRLTPQQRRILRDEATAAFGADACVRLFGSRVDDSARGGDIDLHVEADGSYEDLLKRELRLHTRLMRKLGDRRVDIVVQRRGAPMRPVDESAHATGIAL